jgi:transposase-like protein
VSRRLKSGMQQRLDRDLSRRLDEVRLAALLIDGIALGDGTIVAALGILEDGTKEPLGIRQGSTENATVCAALLQNLLERGLVIDQKVLAIIDGGKGLRKALSEVFGDRLLVQRCQVHKRRNVLGHLPQKLHTTIARQLTQAYKAETVATAKRSLKALQGWLDRAGHEGAATSLAEGLDETLTVLRLGLPTILRRSLSTTNAIESALGRVRRTTRNVKRWRGGDMASRWCATALLEAQRGFRRIKGYKDMSRLLEALADPAKRSLTEAA